ncbi:hypothetical protein [Acinetobacter sp. YH12043]|uniref:hypothetical protein n=1 Tax=Acinetobacter sp. YH12043 TaxID=2601050 RepID=UPI0015D1A94D|nr:hypothetical protein [Acinetobacter sp. YH12043]
MTTQLINEATYNALTTIPVEARTAEMQQQIEAYEAANSLNVDVEEHAPEAPVEPTVATVEVTDTNTQLLVKDAANDEPEAPVAFIDTVEQDDSIAEQMIQSLAVLDDLLSITDDRYKHFLALAAKATCLVKWTGPFILDVRVGDNGFAKHVANTLGLLSFNHFLADSVLNKEIKEKQLLSKYLTICSVPTTAKRDSAVVNYDQVKKGCQFVVHTQAMKYVHNDDLNIGKLENVFSTEQIVNTYTTASTAILRVRLGQQEWVEKNNTRIEQLVSDLNAQRKAIAPKVKAETFKAWSGILLLAALWDKAVFADMVALMNEQVGTQGLEIKEKLACALSVVVPEYEDLMTRFNAEQHITTKLVGSLVKGFGLTDYEVSQGFFDLGIPMKDNKGGYELATLKAKFTEVVKYDDQAIQTYLTKLQPKPEMDLAA